MYSKAGRATSEFFSILQHGQEIIEQKPKFFKGSQTLPGASSNDKLSDMVAKKFGQNGVLKDLAGILDADNPKNQFSPDLETLGRSKSEKKTFEPFSQMVSRENREKVLSFKVVSSNAAYYQPKYERVEKKNPVLVNYSKSPTKRMFDELIAVENAKSAEYKSDLTLPPINNNKTTFENIKGALPLARQVGRADLLEEAKKKKVCQTDALGEAELPAVLSSVPRLPRIKFSRTMSRKDMSPEGPASLYLSYTPNHEFVKKSLGLVGAKFNKVTGRRDETKDPYYTYEAVYDYDEYVKGNKSQVYAQVKSPVFEKMAPRERDPDSKYPGYLQQSMSSRVSDPPVRSSRRSGNDSISITKSLRTYASPVNGDASILSNVLQTRN